MYGASQAHHASSLPPPHGRCLGKLSSEVTKMKQRDAAKLNEEYQRLVRGLAETGVQVPAADAGMAGPGAWGRGRGERSFSGCPF